MSENPTPGRRLTDDEERRGAELFAAGRSEREVARELGVGVSTAHRLKERLKAAESAAEGSGGAETDEELSARLAGSVIHMRMLPGDRVDLVDPADDLAGEVEDAIRGELLDQLGQRREELAALVADHQGRQQASRDAIAALDAERLELIAAGKDAAPLRPRRRDAEDDLADSGTAEQIAAAQLAQVDARIAEVRQEQADVDRKREQDRAAALGARLAPQAAQALREAVTGDVPVRALAELGARLAQAETVCGQSWDTAVMPPLNPGLGPVGDPWHRAVSGLWQAARRGDVEACQRAVPACVPWQDRDPAEMDRIRADVQANADRLHQLALDNMNRNLQRGQGGQPMMPQLPNPLPGAVISGRTGW